jgi:hypothetical protein
LDACFGDDEVGKGVEGLEMRNKEKEKSIDKSYENK